MRLIIAEKPFVSKAIAAELGVTGRGDGDLDCGSTRVIGCFGHPLEQADPDAYLRADVPTIDSSSEKLWRAQDLPIISAKWPLRPRAESRQPLTIIGRLIKEASEIANAGDPDREAQRLIDEVPAHFQWPGRTHRPKKARAKVTRRWWGCGHLSCLQTGLR